MVVKEPFTEEWWEVMLSRRFIRSYVMILTKSTLSQILGACSGVKAIMSPILPGVAIERSLSPMADLIAARRRG